MCASALDIEKQHYLRNVKKKVLFLYANRPMPLQIEEMRLLEKSGKCTKDKDNKIFGREFPRLAYFKQNLSNNSFFEIYSIF